MPQVGAWVSQHPEGRTSPRAHLCCTCCCMDDRFLDPAHQRVSQSAETAGTDTEQDSTHAQDSLPVPS
eukprot:15299521-Alexandrium_andersonii.AAC.1